MAGWITEQDFAECLAFSRTRAESTDLKTIQSIIPGCVEVLDVENDMTLQRLGIDYVAKLRRGAEILIDAKARVRGCSKYWTDGEPELALEIWSVMPDDSNRTGTAGWTLNESKATDYTLHTFDREDCEDVFLLPFQLLRSAFRRNLAGWRKTFGVAFQHSRKDGRRWKSSCVFVPVNVVLSSIENEMRAVAVSTT